MLLDDRDRILDELEVVEVVELRRIVLGTFGIEQLQAARPGLERVLPDDVAGEDVRPALGGVLRQRAHRRHDGLGGPVALHHQRVG